MKDVLEDLENFEVEGGNSTTFPKMPEQNSKRKFSSWNTADQKVNKTGGSVNLELND